MADLPVMCTLGPAARQARREGVFADLLRRAEDHQEISDGHRLRFASGGDTLVVLARAIDLERQCCRFLTFRVTVEADDGPVWLDLTGPPGTREFVGALLEG
jgi:hypothetical protein